MLYFCRKNTAFFDQGRLITMKGCIARGRFKNHAFTKKSTSMGSPEITLSTGKKPGKESI
jgi:hypothetical protein